MLQPWVYQLAETLEACDVVPAGNFLRAAERVHERDLQRARDVQLRQDAAKPKRRRFFR